jgi:hypothetical protein
MTKLKQSIFPFLIAFAALSVSASAAFYSVSGLSKLFAGASLEVIVMASSLEFAKLVIASLLYQYWDSINKALRTYLSIATVVLILITSMGIYGFLSAAYQETANKAGSVDAQVELLETKKQNFTQQRDLYNTEKTNLVQGITQLQTGLAGNKTSYVDKKGRLIQSTSSANTKSFDKQLDRSNSRQSEISAKLDVINDSIFKLDTKILKTKTNSDTAGELGPLKYLSNLTGTPMDQIINYLLLVIIFVFDPLAISLVIAANFAFSQVFPKKNYKKNLYGEQEEIKLEDVFSEEKKEGLKEFILKHKQKQNIIDMMVDDGLSELYNEKENDERMNIIGQNGNEGTHYELNVLDTNKDGVVDEGEVKTAQSRLSELNHLLNSSISSWRRKKTQNEINIITSALNDDETKTY